MEKLFRLHEHITHHVQKEKRKEEPMTTYGNSFYVQTRFICTAVEMSKGWRKKEQRENRKKN